MSSLSDFLFKPSVQRFIWEVLRSVSPVILFGKNAIITRYHDVIDVLKRDTEFTLSEINLKRMEDVHIPFFLGMDRCEQRDREAALLQQVVRKEDLALIQNLVKEKAQQLIEKVLNKGRIDIVGEYSRVVPLALIESYFGLPPDENNNMKDWMRLLFDHIFLNLSNNQKIKNAAIIAATTLKQHFDKVLKERKLLLLKGDKLNDNVLNRLLILQQNSPWITDDVIRRNICGFIIGSLDTTNKCTSYIIDVLLEKPGHLKEAQKFAAASDITGLGKYILEALRFKPHNPLVIRYCSKGSDITSNGRTYRIPAGSTVYIGTVSAMWDKTVFPEPEEINLNRTAEYLHFSYGMHACSGKYISMVQIPELMAGLLKLRNLRRASGAEGKIKNDGSFPDRFILEFDNQTAAP